MVVLHKPLESTKGIQVMHHASLLFDLADLAYTIQLVIIGIDSWHCRKSIV